jgi:hypothetical protein
MLLATLAAGAGCADLGDQVEEANTSHEMLETTNGLSIINGLSVSNGLGSNNGLSVSNGLSTLNGLSVSNGLMTTASGRSTVSYLVRCALPAGTSITKKDQYGNSYTYTGAMGLAPGWQTGACDTVCQETVSACMLAHINTAGVHVPLWVVAQNPSVGWGLSPEYPNQEGSFFGNIFVTGAHGESGVAAHYCNGKDYNEDVVPGRIGARQTNAPYTDPFPGKGYCKDYCTPADTPYAASGYKACNGWNKVLTVWRKAGG